MNDRRNPNKRNRIFDDLRASLFLTRESITFEVDRAVADRLDEVIDELGDCLSAETREEFTRAKLCELCLTALVDEYEKKQTRFALRPGNGKLKSARKKDHRVRKIYE